MSNLTHLTRFLDWVKGIPEGVHLGKEILSKAGDYKFLNFSINQPVLHLFARIIIDGQPRPLEAYVLSITIDPKDNLLLMMISNEFLKQPRTLEFSLDKLKSFEQLSTDNFIERTKSSMRLASQILSTQSRPPIRRSKCDSALTQENHPI